MTIDRIAATSQPRVFKLHLSDGSVLKTQDYVVADLGLCPGMELDEAALEALKNAVGLASAKERAVRIVSASGVSKKDLEHRLTQKGESEEHARAAVGWLTDLELLDDRKTAEQLVRSAAARGYGRARIKQILFEKRIPEEYWAEALDQVPDQSDAVDRFLERRFRGCDPDEKETKRAVDALLRRGHSWQDIKEALRRYNDALEIETDYDP